MTDKLVYLMIDESPYLKEKLRQNGIQVVAGDGEYNDAYLAGCHALIPGKKLVTREILNKAPNLQIVAKYGVGMDRIDIDSCTEKGIVVTNTPLSTYVSVAEHTIALMMATMKRFSEMSAHLKRDNPDYYGCRKNCRPVELSGKTLFLIGFGNIGRRVAQYARAFEMRILYYDPYVDPTRITEKVERVETIEQGLREADIVSLHVPGLESNRNMIGERELAGMKKTAILVNTSRGMLVDEDALYEVLKERRIMAAGLDVFTHEPIMPGNPMLGLDNVIVSPHCAANTPEAHQRAELCCADNILECFEGRVPKFCCNATALGYTR